MTRPRDRSRLPAFVSALLTVSVLALAAVVLFEVATVAGAGKDGPASTAIALASSQAATATSGPTPAALDSPVLAAIVAQAGSQSAQPRPAVALASSAATIATRAPESPLPSTSPKPSVNPSPSPTSTLKPAPTAGPFSMDLYRRGDFVSELTKVMCVPAAMQTMINIMSPGADTSGRKQQQLYALARKLSPKTLKGSGAEPEGWAKGLTQLGFGSYVVDVEPTRNAAIKAAAKALRLTGRPVGILAWRGAHSWVMSGFKSTTDPALTNSFTVTHVYIEDVWYPRVSSIWGPSRKPDALVPVGLLPEDILPWHRPTGRYPGKDGKYVLVLPAKAS